MQSSSIIYRFWEPAAGLVVDENQDICSRRSSGSMISLATRKWAVEVFRSVRDSVRFDERLKVAYPIGVARPLTGVAVAIGSLASAPGVTQVSDATRDASKFQEVVVTAQRRTERLQDVPISAQVIGGQSLTTRSLSSLEDLTQTVPAVHVGPSGATSDMYIRGIGSGGNESFDQSVGLFIDDIYHGRSRTTQATFLDVEQIEILKGPQSTFFGNNAIAGALSIATKKPGDTFDSSVHALYGQYGQYRMEGAIGGPIAEPLGVRVALTANGTSGWIDNVVTGRHVPDENNIGSRLTLQLRADEGLEAILKVEGSKHRESGAAFSGQPMQIVNCPPPAPITSNFAGPGCAQYLAVGGLPTGLGSNKTADDPGQGNDLSTSEDVVTLKYHRWDHTFTSVSGYYSYHFNLNFGNDATPLTLLTTQAPEKYHQFSQEFRVASPTTQPIEYLAGAYLQTDRTLFGLENNYFFLNPTPVPFATLFPNLPLGRNITFSQGERSYAIFGSATWKVTDALKLSGGLRGSWVDKNYRQSLFYGAGTQDYGAFVALPAALESSSGFFGQGIPGTLSGDRSDKAWMPSARAQYKIGPQAMIYFSFARGFKAGGFNGTDTTGVAANIPFGPEHVAAYEVGLKSEWLANTVLLNLALFRSDYDDLQVSINQLPPNGGPGVLLVRNAASSRSQGVEFEGQWGVSQDVRLSVNATYLDSHYITYPNAGATIVQLFRGRQFQDLSGRPTEYAPHWSGSLYATYSTLVAAGYKLTVELSPYFSSSYFLHDSDDPFFEQGSYVRLDARVSLGQAEGRWAVDVIGKNLADRVILGAFGGYYSASKQEPRSVAAQVRLQW